MKERVSGGGYWIFCRRPGVLLADNSKEKERDISGRKEIIL